MAIAKLAYDPLNDYEPVFLINKTPNVCVLNPAIPANNMAEFVAHIKAGKLRALGVTTLQRSPELPDVRDKLQAQGTVPVGGSPADLRKFQEAEIEKWTKVARAAKVQL